MSGRLLAVDYGRKRVGLAVTDELGMTAQPLPTIHVSGVAEAVAGVTQVAETWSVREILVGVPLNMDGSRGPMADAATRFARSLEEASNRPVQMWDERLTSAEARRSLLDAPRRVRGGKGVVDQVAAVLLLQNYLSATTEG